MNILSWLRRHRVAVLKGGWSRERAISLKTGAAVEQAFKRLGIPAIGIDVDRSLSSVLQKKKIKFCFIALHGTFGEDGGVQSLLELLHIPYTGSGPAASVLAMDKNISKKLFVKAGVSTPDWITLQSSFRQVVGRNPYGESGSSCGSRLKACQDDGLKTARGWLSQGSLFVKPNDQGSAIGASRVDRQSQMASALKRCFAVSKTALVEKFIPGRELTVGILGKQALPVVEIIPEHAFYDYHSKYAAGGSRHMAPAVVPASIARRAQNLSLKAFNALGCSVYGRVDLLLRKNDDLTVLEVNTIPGMTATSLLPEAAKAAGLEFDDLVLHICEHSLRRVRS